MGREIDKCTGDGDEDEEEEEGRNGGRQTQMNTFMHEGKIREKQKRYVQLQND